MKDTVVNRRGVGDVILYGIVCALITAVVIVALLLMGVPWT